MNLKFNFNHSNLSAVELQKIGIKSTRELEEVILGESFFDEFEDVEFGNFLIATGFTLEVTALVIAFAIEYETLDIILLDARKATIEEIKKHFCKYCT